MSNVLSLLAKIFLSFNSCFFLRTGLETHVNDSGYKIHEQINKQTIPPNLTSFSQNCKFVFVLLLIVWHVYCV